MQQLVRRLILLLCLASAAGIPQKAFATHLAGADLTYTCLGGNTYQIELTFYRDCLGSLAPNGWGIEFKSISCNQYFTDTLLKATNTGQEITYPCPGLITSCDNPNSTNPGIQKYTYTGIISFPMQCSDWVISWTGHNRNCDITTLVLPQPCLVGSNPPMYVSTTLDNLNTTCNSSPHFSNIPIVFVCIGQNFTYNHGAIDPDGDSLAYSLVDPLINESTPVTFQSGYSTTNPITSSPALAIDPVTGDITMSPTQAEVGVLAVRVDEYRNGVLIGHVIRDMEIYVRACNNNLPTASGINGTTSRDTTVCPDAQLCFDIFTNDLDSNQIVTLTWNSGITNATFTVSGFPYPTGHFCWTPTENDISATAHQFTVNVVDNNCPNSGYQTYSFNVLINSPLVNINLTDISCHGLNDGAITVVPVNPGGFSYSWQTGGQTSAGITNLGAGSYPVTVFDSATGCSATFPNTITDPAILTASSSAVNGSCAGTPSGIAIASGAGGTAPYSYSWNTVPPTLNDTATGLSAGNYDVTITDSHGCTATSSVVISTSSTALNISVDSVTNLLCHDDNYGSVTVSVNGGTPGYTYMWNTSPPQNGPTATGLIGGIYTVTITDSLGCSAMQTATVNAPPQINIAGSSDGASCNLSDGTAHVNVSGGTPGYTYAWAGYPDVTDSLPNVPVGLYTVTISDSNGCSTPYDVLVQSLIITSTANAIASVSCSGSANGAAVATAANGTPPYIFEWNTVPPQVNDTAVNLAPGLYVVTITDSANCSTVDTVNIPNAQQIIVSTATSASSCSGDSTGVANAHATGGNGPYTFSWSPYGGTDSTAVNLIAGSYTVTVNDITGCTSTSSITIQQTTSIVVAVDNIVQPNCNGAANGSINISVTGGNGPYQYSWNPGGAHTEDLSNIDAGIYFVQITDQSGCTQQQQVNVNQPSPVSANAGGDSAICSGGSIQLMAHAVASGATGTWGPLNPYTFSDVHDPNAIVNNVTPGYNDLTWTVTDANGCTGSDVVRIFNYQNLSVDAGTDINLCSLQPVQLNATMIPNFSGMWSGPSQVTFNDDTLNSATATLTDYSVDTLTWTVMNNVCATSDYLVVAIYQQPVAAAGDSSTVCEPRARLLAFTPQIGTGIWSARTPTTATIDNPTDNPVDVAGLPVGNTVFVWTVSNGTCSDEDTVVVFYDEACELDLPSAFSPNDDHFNDGYVIHGIEGYPNNTFRVFNRWGNEVFSKEHYLNEPPSWTGQNKSGEPLPEGTYYVILQINDKNISKNTYVDLRRFTGK